MLVDLQVREYHVVYEYEYMNDSIPSGNVSIRIFHYHFVIVVIVLNY